MRDPLYLVSTAILLVAMMALPEIRAIIHQGNLFGNGEVITTELLFIASVVINKKIELPGWAELPRAIKMLCAVWLFWALASTVFAQPLLFNSLFHYTNWYVHGLFGLTLWAYIQSYKERQVWLQGIIVIGFIIYAVYLSYSYIFADDVVLKEEWRLAEFGFNHIRHFGYYLAVVVPVSAGLVMLANYRLLSPLMVLGLIGLITVWALILWAGGRGPIMAVAVSTLLLFPLLWRVTRPAYLISVMVISVLLGAGLSTAMPKGFGIKRLIETVEKSKSVDQFSSDRLTIWKKCIGDIKGNPWLGVGPDNYKYNCGLKSRHTRHPHGVIVQALLDWGIVGAVIFFVLVLLTLKSAAMGIMQAAEPLTSNLTGLWAALTLLAFSMVDGTLYYAFPMMFIATGLALAFQPEPAEDAFQQTSGRVRSVYLLVTLSLFAVYYVI